MKKFNKNEWDNIQEAGSFKKLPIGGYICAVKAAEDMESKECLKLEFDIVKGDCKGWFAEEYKNDKRPENQRKWPNGGTLYRSYKENALPMFKGFITALTESNPGKFDVDKFLTTGDVGLLKNKYFGIIVGEEEYVNNSGVKRVRPRVASVRSVSTIENGDFEVPELKVLSEEDLKKLGKKGGKPEKEKTVNPFADEADEVEDDDPDVASPFDDDEDPFK